MYSIIKVNLEVEIYPTLTVWDFYRWVYPVDKFNSIVLVYDISKCTPVRCQKITLSIAFKFEKIGKINFWLQKMICSRKSEKKEKDSNYTKGPQHKWLQNSGSAWSYL
jgi:hypothetical protein